ncbi:MAG: septal ring lytic transglycosylase RlpA family protein [Croceibacterium sp.]
MTDRRVPKPLKAMLAGAAVLIALGGALAPGYAEEAAPAASAPAIPEEAELPRFVADPVVMDTQALEDKAELAAEADTDEMWEPLGSGVASYYAAKFDGRRTASGETFRNGGYTAAHRTLPFGTMVKVSRNGRSVVVKINDRGPFTPGRVIDVSQAAARDLGLIGPGHATVTLALAAE